MGAWRLIEMDGWMDGWMGGKLMNRGTNHDVDAGLGLLELEDTVGTEVLGPLLTNLGLGSSRVVRLLQVEDMILGLEPRK